MATSTYRVMVDGEERMSFSGDFAQASSPILLDGRATPFQVADARHSPQQAVELLLDWAESEGGAAVGRGEEYEVVEGK